MWIRVARQGFCVFWLFACPFRLPCRNPCSSSSYSLQLLAVFCLPSSFPVRATCLANVFFCKCLINYRSSYIFFILWVACVFPQKIKAAFWSRYNLSLSGCCPQWQRAQELDRRERPRGTFHMAACTLFRGKRISWEGPRSRVMRNFRQGTFC